MTNTTPAIAHVVTWRLNGMDPTARRQQAARMVQAFEATRPDVDGLLQMHIGANAIEAPDAWDVALYMVFASRAHLDAYQMHPSHLAIKKLVGPMRAARAQVDFEITSAV